MSLKNTLWTLFLSAGLITWSADFAVGQNNVIQQEIVDTLSQKLPTPVTENDRIFIEKNKNNKNIQRNKIMFTQTAIEIDGLKFSRNIVKYSDVKKTPWLKGNVYRENGYDYFTFGGVQKLLAAGYMIPTNLQRRKAADALWWYGMLGLLLDYPKAGGHTFYSVQNTVGSWPLYSQSNTLLWSSTPRVPNINAYGVWFDGHDGSRNLDDQLNARSVVFLEK